jgi:hypothetical protein
MRQTGQDLECSRPQKSAALTLGAARVCLPLLAPAALPGYFLEDIAGAAHLDRRCAVAVRAIASGAWAARRMLAKDNDRARPIAQHLQQPLASHPAATIAVAHCWSPPSGTVSAASAAKCSSTQSSSSASFGLA